MQPRKAIFITGAGSGIGQATARLFAARGWFIGIADINPAGIDDTAAQLPAGSYSRHAMDVRSRTDWATALADFWAASGERLDIMFSNAGIARGGAFEDVAHSDHDQMIDINIKGVVYGAEAAFPYLKQVSGSCLLNCCSAAGIAGAPGLATYVATKFAVRGLSESLAIEWAAHGIAVRTIMPSFIDTPLLDGRDAGTAELLRDQVIKSGLEITPVAIVAQRAWDAAHGDLIHTVIGATALRVAAATLSAPWLLNCVPPSDEPDA
ncbi:MAG: SDR family oxidoreductase [Sphingomonadaceae bacterium]